MHNHVDSLAAWISFKEAQVCCFGHPVLVTLFASTPQLSARPWEFRCGCLNGNPHVLAIGRSASCAPLSTSVPTSTGVHSCLFYISAARRVLPPSRYRAGNWHASQPMKTQQRHPAAARQTRPQSQRHAFANSLRCRGCSRCVAVAKAEATISRRRSQPAVDPPLLRPRSLAAPSGAICAGLHCGVHAC